MRDNEQEKSPSPEAIEKKRRSRSSSNSSKNSNKSKQSRSTYSKSRSRSRSRSSEPDGYRLHIADIGDDVRKAALEKVFAPFGELKEVSSMILIQMWLVLENQSDRLIFILYNLFVASLG